MQEGTNVVKKRRERTCNVSMKLCVSKIPEEGDHNALTHCTWGSMALVSLVSMSRKSSTPFASPALINFSRIGIWFVWVATINFPTFLYGTPFALQ